MINIINFHKLNKVEQTLLMQRIQLQIYSDRYETVNVIRDFLRFLGVVGNNVINTDSPIPSTLYAMDIRWRAVNNIINREQT